MSGIVRTYKRDDKGVLTFREAWVDGPVQGPVYLVVNHGTVGHQSATEETEVEFQEAAEALLAAFEVQCAEDGFVVLPPEEQHWVLAEWALKSNDGTERDRYLERKAKDALTAYLAWRGIGTVESTRLGEGRLTIAVLTPDPARAVVAIKACIREAKLDFTKLTISSAPYGDITATKVRHAPR